DQKFEFGAPRQDSNLRSRLRRPVLFRAATWQNSRWRLAWGASGACATAAGSARWHHHRPGKNIRKWHATAPGHPFAGAGSSWLPCRAAPAATCNGDVHTESEIMQAPQLGHYEIDASRSTVRFRTRHMFGLGPVRGTFAIRSGSAEI